MDIVSVVPDPIVTRWAQGLVGALLTPEHLRFAYRQGNLSMEQVWVIASQTGLDVAPWGVRAPSRSNGGIGEAQG